MRKADIQANADQTINLVVEVTDNSSSPLSATANVTITIKAIVVAPTIDTSAPTITSFAVPSSSASLTVPISELVCTDNVGVAGCLITETASIPSANDKGWISGDPTSYTFSAVGTKTLYAWSKDAAGNVSKPATATLTVKLLDLSPTYSEYLFEETSGITAIDSKGGNDGTISTESVRSEGIIGNGINFNGSGYVDAGNSFSDNVQNEVTMSAWLKPSAMAGNYQGIIMHGGPNEDSFALYLKPDTKKVAFKTTGTSSSWIYVDNVNALWDGNWHHLAVTYNGAEKIIYLDNEVIYKIAATGSIESGQGYKLVIGAGRDITPSLFYEGAMDEVRVYNYALTSSEISDLYNRVVSNNQPVTKTEDISICEGSSYKTWTTAGQYERILKAASGVDSIVTTNLFVNPVYNVSEDVTISDGESYLGWTTSGEYETVLTSVNGCDSIITINLTVLKNISTTEEITICEGENYMGWNESGQYQRVLEASSGADSTVTTNLWVNPVSKITEDVTISEGENYLGWTSTGQYEQVLTSSEGCDSIIITDLTVTSLQVVNKTENIEICEGENYLGWSETGKYSRTADSVAGIKTIMTTNLVVNPVSKTTENVIIPSGENYEGWTTSGQYQRVLSSVSGCDSIVTTYLTVVNQQDANAYAVTEQISICEGEDYLGWNTAGIYQRKIAGETSKNAEAGIIQNTTFESDLDGWYTWTASGYSVNAVRDTKEYQSAPAALRIDCVSNGAEPSSIQWFKNDLKIESGKTYELSFYAKSSVTFSPDRIKIFKKVSPYTSYGNFTTPLPSFSTSWKQYRMYFTATTTASDASLRFFLGTKFPTGNSLFIDDIRIIEKDLANEVIVADTLITTYLAVNPISNVSENITIADGESYKGWLESGLYERTLTAVTGCDSIVTTNLTVLKNVSTTEEITICEGEEYLGWTESGQYQRVLKTISGADSTVATNLWVNPVKTTLENVTIAEGENYNGWTTSGNYQLVLSTAAGCDSIVNTKLTVIASENPIREEYITICEGEEYLGWTSSGVYERTVSAGQDNSALDSNLIINGDFNDGLKNWDFWSAQGYQVKTQIDRKDYYSAPSSLRLDCSSNGSVAYYLQLVSDNFAVEAGKEYQFSFYAKATTEFAIGNLIIMQSSSPFTEYGKFSVANPTVSTSWNKVSVTFTATQTAADASLRIYLGNSLPEGESLYIDDISLNKYLAAPNQPEEIITTYLTVNPVTHTSEDIFITEGESYEGFTVSGEYERTLTTVAGCDSIVTTFLTVEPAQVADETINTPINGKRKNSLTTDVEIKEIKKSNDFKLYPNPASSYINIDFLYMPDSETQIQIIDINGKTVHQQIIESASTRIDVNDLPTGMYYINSVSSDQRMVKKLIIQK